MNKPVTAQEVIALINNYRGQKYYGDPGHDNGADYQLNDADQVIDACKAYLEEMENGTG